MWRKIQELLFHRTKQHQGIAVGEKQWAITARTKRHRRHVREKMCSISTVTTCPELFSSLVGTISPVEMLAAQRNKSNSVFIVSEHDERDWWVSDSSEENKVQEMSLQFHNKGLKQWEARRREWLQCSSHEEKRRTHHSVKNEKSLSRIVSTLNTSAWSKSMKHDSDSW